MFWKIMAVPEHNSGELCVHVDSEKIKPAVKVQNVVGVNERANDVLYCPPFNSGNHLVDNGIVVFFGGDMQDFQENMNAKEKTKGFVNWSLENMSKILSMHYKNCHILIVRPISIEDGIFSSYSNFVPSLEYGVPKFTPNHDSILHLNKLIKNTQNIMENMNSLDIRTRIEHTCKLLNLGHCCLPPESEYRKKFSECYLELVGFSKGCVVLNQFLHEFHYFKKNSQVEGAEESNELTRKIRTMRWMDGGHNGREGTWITSGEILSSYAELGKQTYVHVTPYQVCCKKRPWIGKEEAIFTSSLIKKKVDIKRKLHFEHSVGNLDDHFKLLLDVFKEIT
ncbi:UPF0565 protein C2orf69 homolog isoform X2 [Coccinella septempunctata]|uniref:UPF0565 protein C2orf69 homolog isoform X2 n=1 Tax=Coccinella septempunctata TaxID=41139 RepID=UPI001D084748|nr:UPF0565 protein C2orf69 homolog isoform X2 [Coccinella septempunctata]XP_044761012.1 UPF0565 protein C2orf69 homolog isoform X2 [Coccinella septempunctata]XP_044761013.1 UPF0565 protein C2orf69 homolog isoform X2 [Coccinella septempunctata]